MSKKYIAKCINNESTKSDWIYSLTEGKSYDVIDLKERTITVLNDERTANDYSVVNFIITEVEEPCEENHSKHYHEKDRNGSIDLGSTKIIKSIKKIMKNCETELAFYKLHPELIESNALWYNKEEDKVRKMFMKERESELEDHSVMDIIKQTHPELLPPIGDNKKGEDKLVFKSKTGISAANNKEDVNICKECQNDVSVFGLCHGCQISDNVTTTKVVERKQTPIYSGVIKYFPNAIKAVAQCSFIGNDQHNPGTPLHWDRAKSGDELDACMRHLTDHASGDKMDDDGILHLTKCAWRLLAMLEKTLEK